MDNCDGVSPLIIAVTNSRKNIGDVYTLTGAKLAGNAYTIIDESFEAVTSPTIGFLTSCDDGGLQQV
jgi:hypothetical protein